MEKNGCKVANVMQTRLHVVDGLDSVQTAIGKMKELGVSSLLIDKRHAGDEYGVVTVKDIAARVVALNHSPERTSVYQIMTKPALTISSNMHIKYAIRLLSSLDHSRALVTDGGDKLLGFVTLRDLVVNFVDDENEDAH